jgi:hypothetical protein
MAKPSLQEWEPIISGAYAEKGPVVVFFRLPAGQISQHSPESKPDFFTTACTGRQVIYPAFLMITNYLTRSPECVLLYRVTLAISTPGMIDNAGTGSL